MPAPSAVWLHMTRVSKTSVECNKCKKGFTHSVGGGTSTLRLHLQNAHSIAAPVQKKSVGRKRTEAQHDTDEEGPDDPDSQDGQNQTRAGGTPAKQARVAPTPPTSPANSSTHERTSSGGLFRGPMDKCISNANSFSINGSRAEECTNALLYAVAQDNMPLAVTERKGFRKFVKVLQPLYKLPSEPTVTKKMQEKRQELKEKVQEDIQNAKSLVLTMDIWTQKGTMRSYLGITVHYPQGTQMISVEAGVIRLTERKTSIYLRSVIQDFIIDWGIDRKKVLAAVSDGGANIKRALKDEFPGRHIICIGHMLDNIGQRVMTPNKAYSLPSERENDGAGAAQAQGQDDADLPDRESDIEEDDDDFQDAIENSFLRKLIIKVKKTVKFFRQSEVATSELVKLQMQENNLPESKTLKLVQEVKTRWNSCFAMLDRFLTLQEMVARVILKIQNDKNSKSKPPEILSRSDIEALAEVRDLLRPLDIATREVSREKYPTLSKCIPLVNALISSVTRVMTATPIGLNLKADLLKRLENTFGNNRGKIEELKMYQCATILDPRFKKSGFSTITAASDAAGVVAQMVKRQIQRKQGAAAERTVAEEPSATAAGNVEDDFWSTVDTAAKQACTAQDAADLADGAGIGYVAEFKSYLNAGPLDRKAHPNPLEAWEGIKHLYPNVYEVAMRFLPILCSSIPCERLFSHAGLIATQIRNRLSGKNLSSLIFLRSIPEDMWFRKVS